MVKYHPFLPSSSLTGSCRATPASPTLAWPRSSRASLARMLRIRSPRCVWKGKSVRTTLLIIYHPGPQRSLLWRPQHQGGIVSGSAVRFREHLLIAPPRLLQHRRAHLCGARGCQIRVKLACAARVCLVFQTTLYHRRLAAQDVRFPFRRSSSYDLHGREPV